MRKLIYIVLLIFASCNLFEKKPTSFFWGFVVEGFPITKNALEDLQKSTGITPQMVVFFLQWSTQEPLAPSLDAIWKAGAVPCLTWEPMTIVDGKESAIPYTDLTEGKYDAYIASTAKEIKSFGKPIIIRFSHEMNLSRYHWGTGTMNPHSPEIYQKMFRYVVDQFRKENIKTVLFAFCPNVESIPNEAWNKISQYYPGDAYVDILGMDGYNWNITSEVAKERNLAWTSPWKSFEQIFEPLYLELKKLAPNKPMIVFETATALRASKKKSEWIQEAEQTAIDWDLEGIVWFQANKEEDWRMNQNQDFIIPTQVGSFQTRVQVLFQESN